MLSFASSRADRFAAATGALLLQLGFIAAFLYAFPLQTPPRQIERELIFLLPRVIPRIVPPRQGVETGPSTTAPTIPAVPLPSLTAPLTVTPAPVPAPSDLQNFGQALSDCAPETYAKLAPEQRARCQRPGEGVAIQQSPDPLHPPRPAKDEANWQEQFRRAHLPYPECPPSNSWEGCEMAFKRIELAREKQTDSELAYQKAQALKPSELPLPQHLGALPRGPTESAGGHPQ